MLWYLQCMLWRMWCVLCICIFFHGLGGGGGSLLCVSRFDFFFNIVNIALFTTCVTMHTMHLHINMHILHHTGSYLAHFPKFLVSLGLSKLGISGTQIYISLLPWRRFVYLAPGKNMTASATRCKSKIGRVSSILNFAVHFPIGQE